MNTDSGTARKEARIAELDRIIQTEEAKPDPDYQLIDDCIREIGELEGAKVDFSEEEVAKATGKILRKVEREKKRKRIVRYAAAAAAVFVLVGGVTACTVNPNLIDWFARIMRLHNGSTLVIGDDYYKLESIEDEYQNVYSIAEEGIVEYYPAYFPEGISLSNIRKEIEDDKYKYLFFFSDPSLFIVVEKSGLNTIVDEKNDKRELQHSYRVVEVDDGYQAELYLDCDLYIICYNDYEELTKIINSMRRFRT